jgi:xanthine dehydrogenase iron-sulfur cluster and FAD-binding subunit A
MSAEAVHAHQMTNTHILVNDFTYLEPESFSETLALLAQHGKRARLLAGGTYLLIQAKMERQAPEYIINVQKVPELAGVAWHSDGLHLGALTTIHSLRSTADVWRDYTALAEACAAFGSTQIQKMGTVGGNLCNGSPASDAVPALLAFDAGLVLQSAEGERELPVEDFLLGPGRTALREGELLSTIRLPRPKAGVGSAFIKLSRVEADLAKVSAAAVVMRDGDRVVECRLALGSVAPTVMRAKEAEALLIGQPFSPELALEAGQAASLAVSPIDDVRSTAWYRREVVKAVAHDVLCVAWERAGQVGLSYQDNGHAHPHQSGNGRGRRPRSLQLGPDEQHLIELTVNGELHRLWVSPKDLLVNVLREDLELTGTKYGCGIGECGACTIHLNGEPALACLTLAVAIDGGEVLTVEGLQGPDGELDPLQDAFIENQAFQCGYCTPGMLMMTKGLLKERPVPTEDDIREYLRGNRCRCTGFASIVRAVLSQVGTHANGSGDGREA